MSPLVTTKQLEYICFDVGSMNMFSQRKTPVPARNSRTSTGWLVFHKKKPLPRMPNNIVRVGYQTLIHFEISFPFLPICFSSLGPLWHRGIYGAPRLGSSGRAGPAQEYPAECCKAICLSQKAHRLAIRQQSLKTVVRVVSEGGDLRCHGCLRRTTATALRI